MDGSRVPELGPQDTKRGLLYNPVLTHHLQPSPPTTTSPILIHLFFRFVISTFNHVSNLKGVACSDYITDKQNPILNRHYKVLYKKRL